MSVGRVLRLFLRREITIKARAFFLDILVRVAFLTNMCIVFDQSSEAGNVKYCHELHARSGLRFPIRFQKDALIVPTRAQRRAARNT